MDRIDRPLSAASAERLDQLFRLYNSRLVRFARTQTRDADAAQDVVMESWVRAGRGLHNLRADDDQAMSWLCTIVRHTATDHYRRYEQPEDWTDAVSSRALPAADSAEDVALTEAQADPSPDFSDLDPVLAVLPERDRMVVRLRMDGLTYGAIGSYYGRSDGAAYWRYQRAVQTLRELAVTA